MSYTINPKNYAVNPKNLYQIVEQDVYLIDFRDSHQFNDLHVKNFMNMTKDQLYSSLQSFNKSKPMYLMCYQGIGTQDMVSQLRSIGYIAYYIDGGFQAFLNMDNTKYF